MITDAKLKAKLLNLRSFAVDVDVFCDVVVSLKLSWNSTIQRIYFYPFGVQ